MQVGSPSSAFRKDKEVPFHVGYFSLKVFQSLEAMPGCVNPLLPTSDVIPAFFHFYIALHLCIYEYRCVVMQRLIFFIIFKVSFFHSQSNICPFLLIIFFCFALSLCLSKCIDPSWRIHEVSPHRCYKVTVFTKPTTVLKTEFLLRGQEGISRRGFFLTVHIPS